MRRSTWKIVMVTLLCVCGWGRAEVTADNFLKIYDPSVGEKEQWYINDHCFIRGADGTWHLFGITHEEPMNPMQEKNFAHAAAAKLTQSPWDKQPYALTFDPNAGERHLWAPHVISHDGTYYMFYCSGGKSNSQYEIHLATSKDLRHWQRHPANPMVIDGYDARDPYILKMGDEWVMYYTATSEPKSGNHIVACRKSKDLIHWGERTVVFTDPTTGTYGGPTDSPQVIRRGEYYYLFIGPRADDGTEEYRGTGVFKSKYPFKWELKDKAGHISAHAAEVIRDVDGQWYVSHCGWGQGGVYLAKLNWNDGVDDNDTSLPIPTAKFRRLSVQTYRDKMKAGWVGQMVGVTWGAPTEFKWMGKIIPEANVPQWKPATVNDAFGQDDLYVEMTFLRSLEVYGLDVSIRQAGIDFANSEYQLWHANDAARENLRRGIAPPDSSHPQFTAHADDIDYQIEADFAGMIAPGMPETAIELGEKFGRIMNYGDGLYGGIFVSMMYTQAFFENDPEKIVESALEYIPKQSQYAEAIRDTLRWYRENPDDWQKTWQLVNAKYQLKPEYRLASCAKSGDFNIDAKINGAYVVMGLLYGKKDPDQTMKITMRCGQDSDCNPSSAAGVLFTTMGFSNVPERFKAIDMKLRFSHTPYDFGNLIDVCERMARQTVSRAGGHVEKEANGDEVFVIPVLEAKPMNFESSLKPGLIAQSRYTKEEMTRIKIKATKNKK